MKYVVLGLFQFFCMYFISCQYSPSQEEINSYIQNHEEFRVLDNFCNNIPKPEYIKFQRKKISSNGRRNSITNSYKSSASFKDLAAFYTNYFKEMNWKVKSYQADNTENKDEIIFESNSNVVWLIQTSTSKFNFHCMQNLR